MNGVDRRTMPGAFLIALVVHGAVVGALFFVGLPEGIVEAVKTVHTILPSLDDYAASTRFEAHEGYRSAPQPFELVRELGTKDSVTVAEVPQAPLETPEMRVASAGVKREIPVPADENPGERAGEAPLVPETSTAVSPARTVSPKIEAAAAAPAPVEDVGSIATPKPVEPRLPGAPVEVARASTRVDPDAAASGSRSLVPGGLGEKVLPPDLHDDRTTIFPTPASSARPNAPPPRAIRSPLDGSVAKVQPLRGAGAPSEGAGRESPAAELIAPVEIARAPTSLPGPGVGTPGDDAVGKGSTRPGAAAAPAIPIGPLADRRDALPTFAAKDASLPRRLAGGTVPFAGANIGPETLLKARSGDNKLKDAERRGGSKASQEAVARGLTWLERHQFPDGHFSLHEFAKQCEGHAPCTGHGNLPCDTAATAFALLPFLGDGHTQHDGKYPVLVERGLDWLIARQKRDGELTTGNEGKARLYGHGLATIALCEAYAMSQDPRLREPAQRALDFIVASQHRASGGWRYQPNEPGDTSVVGWQVMALKSGQMAKLSVPQRSFDLARKWLDSVEGLGSQRGRFGYQSRQPTPSMTAEGLLCRQYLGASRDDPSLLAGADYLLANLPHKQQENSYYWYYGTQTMYHLQGHHWQKWNAALRDLLVATQIKEGPMAGTWNPADRGEVTGGRVFATSLRVLMLEVYYRHLPLYQSLEE
jgi:hypothetical protein